VPGPPEPAWIGTPAQLASSTPVSTIIRISISCDETRRNRAARHSRTGDETIGGAFEGDLNMRLIALMMTATTLLLAACNTVQGVGRDVQSVGETVEDVAD
jgi:predicted small secreted protein